MNKFVKGKDQFKKIENYLKKKEAFEKLFKNRSGITDITEFFRFKEFDGFANRVFRRPSKPKEKPSIYWTDTFTASYSSVWGKLVPWFFSESLLANDLCRGLFDL